MNVKGKTIMITGGAGGLGSVMAEVLAENGANVAILDLPAMKETAEKLSKKLSSEGVTVFFEGIDVTSAGDWERVVKNVKERTGTAFFTLDEDFTLALDDTAVFTLDEDFTLALDDAAVFTLEDDFALALDEAAFFTLEDDFDLMLEEDFDFSLDDEIPFTGTNLPSTQT
ncbi:MAG: SDR family NAD(P)-dependent oxidoreductase [Lachnospiraceae bacterium]|nr:SDR family NAD(P)-dependent oxidoreductase [Lachnospiraceae bacterium]